MSENTNTNTVSPQPAKKNVDHTKHLFAVVIIALFLIMLWMWYNSVSGDLAMFVPGLLGGMMLFLVKRKGLL